MQINVGTVDRVVRAAIGVILLYLALMSGLPAFQAPLLKYGAIVVGCVMLIVAAVRVCPLYTIFGIRTCRR